MEYIKVHYAPASCLSNLPPLDPGWKRSLITQLEWAHVEDPMFRIVDERLVMDEQFLALLKQKRIEAEAWKADCESSS